MMIVDFENLVNALKETGIPFCEYEWGQRPEGDYGVVSIDFEGESFYGDDRKVDRSWEGSVDLFFYGLDKRREYVRTIEGVLNEFCECGWTLNSNQFERSTNLFHIEWTFSLCGVD